MDDCLRAGGRLSQAQADRQEGESRRAIEIVIAISIGAAIALVAWLLWRRRQRRPTSVEAEFHESERRRWEGHRLDPPKGPRP
jgi:hypothetical protein